MTAPLSGVRLWRFVAAAAAGLLLGVALPPWGWWWCAPLGVAALVLAVRGAAVWLAALTGGLAGAVWAAVSLSWLAQVGVDAAVGLTAILAVWWALLGAGLMLVQRVAAWPVFVPAVVVLQETLRSSIPFGGFPWARIGFAAADSPLLVAAPLIGVVGISALLSFAGACVAAAMLAAREGRRAVGLCWLLVPLAGLAVVVAGSPALWSPPLSRTDRGLVAAIVQGGPVATDVPDERRAVLAAHVDQTRALIARGSRPDLVVWPESATDIDPSTDAATARSIESTVGLLGTDLLVGMTTAETVGGAPGRNLVVAWSAETGPGPSYAKRRLVPFGEYLPLRSFLERVSPRFSDVPRDLSAGSVPGVLPTGSAQVGVVTCYEVAFDGDVREVVAQGAEVIAIPTNNATYSGSTQPAQQLAMARVRAAEMGRWVLVAATTGVSAIIGPDGTVASQIADGQAGALTAVVDRRTDLTPTVVTGSWVTVVVSLLGIGAIAVGALRGSRVRPRQGSELRRDDEIVVRAGTVG